MFIRKQISTGKWKLGERLPHEHKIGNQLGVSFQTVRNVMANLAKEGLLERKQRKGTFVSQTKTVGTIAVLAASELLTSSQGFVYQRIVEESRNRIVKAGYRFVLEVGEGYGTERFVSSTHLLDKPVVREMQGVLSTMNLWSLEKDLNDAGLPCVTMSSPPPLSEHTVCFDYRRMLELGVEQLHANGYDDFTIVCHNSPPVMKEKGGLSDYAQSMLLHAVKGREDRIFRIPWKLGFGNVYQAVKDLLSQQERPRALFFCDEVISDVASRVILELGLKVPDELAIITQASVGRQFHFPVPLARVEFDPAEIVSEAWKMLNELIAGKEVNEPIRYVSPTLQHSESLCPGFLSSTKNPNSSISGLTA